MDTIDGEFFYFFVILTTDARKRLGKSIRVWMNIYFWPNDIKNYYLFFYWNWFKRNILFN